MLDRRIIGSLVVAVLVSVSTADAQVIGTFSWQTLPYCNVVTVTVVQQGARYQLAGSDDLCGAGVAPVTGTAVPAAGGVSFGFMAVPPAGPPAHIAATISLATLSGTWSDADGNAGSFAFGSDVDGPSRPAPAATTAIAASQLAPSAYGGTGTAVTIARSDHLHDDRYDTSAEVDTKVAAAIATPNHIGSTQVADGSLALDDIFGSGNFLTYNLGTLTVPGLGCAVVTVSLASGEAFRLFLPFRLGVGIVGSAFLSAYPVTLNGNGGASLYVCNRSASQFSAGGVILDIPPQ